VRRDKQVLRADSEDSKHDDVFSQAVQGSPEEAGVVIEAKGREGRGLIFFGESRAFDHMEMVEFDAPNRERGDEVDGLEHLLFGLARQPEDEVGRHLNLGVALSSLNRVDPTGDVVTALDGLQDRVVTRLEAVLDPKVRALGELSKEL
jgi:hypothetical protein